MSKFQLEKATEKVKFTLAKKGIPSVRAAVVLNLDVSGSARSLFRDGLIQDITQVVAPLAITFDDNQSLDVFTFASGDSYTTEIKPNVTANNLDGYIDKNILNNDKVPKWGGTNYAPVIRSNLKALGFYSTGIFGGGKLKADNGSGFPALIITLTDGANSDQSDIKKLLKECEVAKVNAYFLYIGVGGADFRNIVELGDLYSNVGFVEAADIHKFADSDDVYDQLLPDELVKWFQSTKK